MSLVRIFGYPLLLALVFIATACSTPASKRADSYTFVDETTGVSIELPRSWERRDPDETKRAMLEVNEKFWRKPASEGLSKTGVLFMAMASPYDGPEKTRSVLSCAASPLPPSMDIKPSDVKLVLETTIDSTFGRYEKDVTISKAAKIEISGKEAYRLSVTKANNAPGSFLFIGFLHKNRMIQCFGGYDATFQAEVERALQSLQIK